MIAYKFDIQTNALTPLYADIAEQTAASKNSLRLDTSSSELPILNRFGLPVFSSATFRHPITRERMDFLTVLFEVHQTKNIDTVAVTGLNGTIKTYVSDGDFDIRMRGMLIADNPNDYPIEEVKQLTELLKQPLSIEVVCDYLQLFGIYNLVIQDYNFPQSEGTQNTQVFEINALSDAPIELIELI